MTITAVITGASGFIAGKLAAGLGKNSAFDVIAVSRTGGKGVQARVDDYCQTPAGDILVHLAEDRDRGRVNQMGDRYRTQSGAVLDALLAKQYQYVIYGSSSAVYGEHGDAPFREDAALHAQDTYTRTKLENERKILAVGGAVVRLSNVIGPGMAKNNVLSDIFAQISTEEPVKIRNDRPVRDFIWIDDVCAALVQIMLHRPAGVFNLGSGFGISIGDLARVILSQTGQPERAVQALRATPESNISVVDMTKLKTRLDWSLGFDINDAVRLLLADNSKHG
jgi:UDP-glucose 4-epimerase